jgi:hypothetical protein
LYLVLFLSMLECVWT